MDKSTIFQRIGKKRHMDELIKTIRSIYLAIVTVCFASSVFVGALILEPDFDQAISELERALENRIYLYPHEDIEGVVRSIEEAERAKLHLLLKEELQAAEINVPDLLLEDLHVPINMPLSVFSETQGMLVNRRAVALGWQRSATVFSARSLSIEPTLVQRHKSLPPVCLARIGSNILSPDNPSYTFSRISRSGGRVNLQLLHHQEASDEACSKDGISLSFELIGDFNEVPETSYKSWLQSQNLWSKPMFTETQNGEVIFFNFPNEVWVEIFEKTPRDALAHLISKREELNAEIQIFGLSIQKSLVIWFTPIALSILFSYMYLHIQNAHRAAVVLGIAFGYNLPWVGNFDSNIAKRSYAASVLIWPLVLGILQCLFLYEFSVGFVFSAFAWIVCVVLASRVLYITSVFRAFNHMSS